VIAEFETRADSAIRPDEAPVNPCANSVTTQKTAASAIIGSFSTTARRPSRFSGQ
jgi:hypothetical protein